MENRNLNNSNKNNFPFASGGLRNESKIALIHDHLAQLGGAEKVLQALADIYSEAPIYTLLYKKEHIQKEFNNRMVSRRKT